MSYTININALMNQSEVRFGTSGIRGLVSAMTEEVCYAYTAAFLQLIQSPSKYVVIGHDLRPSSPEITAICATAIRDANKEVIYTGVLPTPAIALYAAHLQCPAIVITGSHIPFDRNGIKFYRDNGEITKRDEEDIKAQEVAIPAEIVPIKALTIDPKAYQHYVDRYVQYFKGTEDLTGVRVAMYAHSSAAREVLPDILKQLGAEVRILGKTDTFIPIDTEAVRDEDIAQAKLWAKEYPFDAIFSTDGDADRPLIGDEQGQWMRGDIVGILCAHALGVDYIATPVSSNTAAEGSDFFKQVIRTKIGSPFVISGMESAMDKNGIVAGFEANGGFLLGSAIHTETATLHALPTRDAVLPMLALLFLALKNKTPVSGLTALLPGRFKASNSQQNFPTTRSQEIIASFLQHPDRAAAILAPAAGMPQHIDTTDGLRMTFSNGDIVHLRPSGNAPELRCYAESDTQEKADQLASACLKRLS
jgi:phosphomannomutase